MSERFTISVESVVTETANVRTLRFAQPLVAEPGQFVMLSDLRSDEKPFSLSECDSSGFAVTFRRVGPFTRRLFDAQPGDRFSIRGAYGSSFFARGKRALVVGGGCAAPPLSFLCRKLTEQGVDVTVVNGARTEADLLFGKRFAALRLRYLTAVEAGPTPVTAVDVAGDLLARESFDTVYAGGPELMLLALKEVTGAADFQFLIERYMKCGLGVCGSCTIDPLGLRACVEGPVLGRDLIAQLSEFGSYRRDAGGLRIPIAAREVCES